MRVIGILGGMSWQSTQGYYQLINQGVADRLGGLHSAEILIRSVDFAPIAQMQKQEQWGQMADLLCSHAKSLEKAGADCVLIGTNTMHLVADEVAAAISIPLLHIADATAKAIQSANLNKVALLGTVFTMQKDFYKGRIKELFGIDVIVPHAAEQALINKIIYDELCLGRINPGSEETYLKVIRELEAQGAQAVILGCTEIGLLVKQKNCSLPLFDTTQIHATSAIEFALT
ncbi:aspartate/glutamate racemase family protein [Planctobacterium marinum]|uniref:aspartate/glutamate racemase family protein n=1 Tax=Planctobacterium marinum TaxID=1631968 RepID=UPI0030C6B52C